MNAVGAGAGLALAVGILAITSAFADARPSVVRRVAPYVSIRTATSALLEPTPARGSNLRRVFAPLAVDSARVLDHLGSSTASVRRRLALTDSRMSVESFRLEQLLWASLGLGLGLVLAIALGAARGVAPLPLAALVVVAGLAGALARDRVLTRAVTRRRARITAELPTVAELLALAVGAGESPTAALERVAAITQGDLAREIERTLGDVRAGATVSTALEALARRVDLLELTRFTDGVTVAIERGSPLSDVLRAQAADARDAARRELMEEGGRREIAMLIPVVFFILPLTVLFALFPGLALIRNLT